MAHKRPLVILIPGIGDRSGAYELFACVWRVIGFDARIVAFGWNDHYARLRPKMQAFLQELAALQLADREVYIIGISAGGTAAVNTFATPRTMLGFAVKKVITVCSPLDTLPGLHNPLLAESINLTHDNLAGMSSEQKRRILSAYAWYDPVVSPQLSRTAGVKTMRIPAVLHPVAIFVALTFCALRLRRFFTKAR